MKIFIIIIVILACLVGGYQVYLVWSMAKIEQHGYSVVEEQGAFEIREYEPGVFISVLKRGEMFDVQNESFMELAGYIFGGNDASLNIAMTAPVQMEQRSDSSAMRFMIPSEYDMNDLPAPQSKEVIFEEEPGFYAAAISFGGFADEAKYKKYQEKLEEYIRTEELEIAGPFIFLGYNPPFQWFNRTNDVMVKIRRS